MQVKMKSYTTIFGEEIIGYIIHDKYEKIVIVSDRVGIKHVVYKSAT